MIACEVVIVFSLEGCHRISFTGLLTFHLVQILKEEDGRLFVYLIRSSKLLFDQEHYGLLYIEDKPATFPRSTAYLDSLPKQFLGEMKMCKSVKCK